MMYVPGHVTTDHLTQIVHFWSGLLLWPVSIAGLLIAYYAMRSDSSVRVVRGALVAIVIAGVFASTAGAAVLYNNCNDPNLPTWLWYASGCWAY